jgi:hypothetical protein
MVRSTNTLPLSLHLEDYQLQICRYQQKATVDKRYDFLVAIILVKILLVMMLIVMVAAIVTKEIPRDERFTSYCYANFF